MSQLKIVSGVLLKSQKVDVGSGQVQQTGEGMDMLTLEGVCLLLKHTGCPGRYILGQFLKGYPCVMRATIPLA